MKAIHHMLDKLALSSREHGSINHSPINDAQALLTPNLFTDFDDVISLQAAGPYGTFRFHELKNESYCVTHDSYRAHEDMKLSVSATGQSLSLHYNLRNNFHWSLKGLKQKLLLKNQYNMVYLPDFECEYQLKKHLQYTNFGLVFTEEYLQRCHDAFPFLAEFFDHVKHKVPAIVNENHFSATPEMMIVIQSILHCNYIGTLKKMYLDSKVPELLLLSFQNSPDQADSKVHLHQSDIQKIHKAKEYLLANMDNPCSIKELARAVGLNDCKLKRGFKQVYSNTVFGILLDERMQKAKALLTESDLSIQEIATITGYKNLSNFTAAFKRKFGYPPSSLKASLS
jgi:AraC family transcriptional regulator, transcriptional activator of the genes for pyochelin and ferripyochelin receptors